MRSGYTGHVTSTEWRWVIVVSSTLVLAAFLPFLWVVLAGPSTTEWQFMGALHDFQKSASHLAKITQGEQGEWLSHYLHTPEPHNGIIIHSLYIALGRIAQLTSLPPIILFHVARVGAALFMYMAIYYLAAAIWMRVRTRRLFFALAATSAGLGWLASPLTGNPNYPDILPSTFFPFHSTLMNVHFPLVIGAMCILVSAVIEALRPGSTEEPSVTNGGVIVFMFGLALSLFYLQALLPLAVTFIGLMLTRSFLKRQISPREIRWMLWFGVPALPVAAYYVIVNNYNEVVSGIWAQQSVSSPPNPLIFMISLGLPLIIAAPGLLRAVRRFEPDGSQVMLIWLVTMVLTMYLLPGFRTDFALGLMIPLAYFGARGSEDFWFKYIPRPWRLRVLVALLPLMTLSHFFVLFAPVSPLTLGTAEIIPGIFLRRDYTLALRWLESQRKETDVALAAPTVSVWLPGWTGMRVVYGFPAETLDAKTKQNAVEAWYNASDRAVCDDVLNGRYSLDGPYTVRYVVYGPEERSLGETVCLSRLLPTVNFGEVTIYRYAPGPISP